MSTIEIQRPQAPPSTEKETLDTLSVVIPAYNEALTLGELLRRVDELPLAKEIIVVDDGSTDGSRQYLESLQTDRASLLPLHPFSATIKILFHDGNCGKGAAVRTGIAHATGRFTVVQDADLEYDPQDFLAMLKPLLAGQADAVYGSRFRGETARVHLFWHALGNKLLTLASDILSGMNLTDMTTGYKMVRTSILQSIPIRSNRFGFEPEITMKLAKLRCRLYEVPVSYHGRSYEEGKKVTFWDGIKALGTLVRFWFVDDLYEQTAGLRTLRIMEGAGSYNRWLFDQCSANLGDRVLEVGAGVGNITKLLLQKPSLIVTDVAEDYVEELRSKFRHFRNVSISAVDLANPDSVQRLHPPMAIDSILSMNMLEHIENDREAVAQMYRLLPSKGKLVILVPAHQALFSDMDRHLDHFRRYTKTSLSNLLQSQGFHIQKSRYLNWLGAIGWFINGRIFRRRLIPSHQVRLFDLLLVFLRPERWISPPFGLSLLIVAEKT